MKTIIVTGTPGTGKTAIAKKLAKRLKFYYLDVNKVINKYKLAEGYDRKRKTKIVGIKKLNKALIDFIKELPLAESSFQHWEKVGNLRSELTQQGIQISTPDAHIAQCCLDLNCYLLSTDKIFSKISSLTNLRLL